MGTGLRGALYRLLNGSTSGTHSRMGVRSPMPPRAWPRRWACRQKDSHWYVKHHRSEHRLKSGHPACLKPGPAWSIGPRCSSPWAVRTRTAGARWSFLALVLDRADQRWSGVGS
ncbi:JM130 [macacine gammaherpesvirus 11]|uniref:JM130 n=2 Tax=macacine gammaherpesvirus 11 TaxID=2560570 RepID=G9JMV8_9GAMA|nr:JM130 [Macaca fuscata rhadinovirus]AAT00107.1 JM130 [Macaca fuscata rhadinovirus]AEW87655.1 JM130 [Macaca fuscata rhadinovirus]AEW87825.1 JM130 [Macaca fuscata rhadinovirus]